MRNHDPNSFLFGIKLSSRDDAAWNHPFLTASNIKKFRSFSEEVWKFSSEKFREADIHFNTGFSVNLAQNMYNWGVMFTENGVDSTLYEHPFDNTALSSPFWEEFDGEFDDIFDRNQFAKNCYSLNLKMKVRRPKMDPDRIHKALYESDDRLLAAIKQEFATVRFDEFKTNPSFLSYFEWASALSTHDVIYTCSSPIAAFLSGKPYCTFATGGDVRIDCGRVDNYGFLMRRSFAESNFLVVTNPYMLGHARRLGFKNAVYLPYPVRSNRYRPGLGEARRDWIEKYGDGTFILSSCRIDQKIKGQTRDYILALKKVIALYPSVRFLISNWGHDKESFFEEIKAQHLDRNVFPLSPVGKSRLIDYYRSCDIVVDQFSGFLGATALEACSIGKPVVMKINSHQLDPIYSGDIPPVVNASGYGELVAALSKLILDKDYAVEIGRKSRDWIMRNHGEERTFPKLRNLLFITQQKIRLPSNLINPLSAPLSWSEKIYHKKRNIRFLD